MRSTLPIFAFALATAAPVAAAEVVPVPEFRSIELRGGGSVIVRPGPAQQVTIVNGSTAFTRVRVDHNGKLKIDACNERCPRQYNLTIEIRSPDMPDAAISGGGSITAAPGFAPQSQVSVAVSGGGQIDVRSVRATSVSAAVNGGGRIRTGHSSTLSAAVNGGGEIRYASSNNVNMATHGGGTVRQGN
jgi:hypothetical protein